MREEATSNSERIYSMCTRNVHDADIRPPPPLPGLKNIYMILLRFSYLFIAGCVYRAPGTAIRRKTKQREEKKLYENELRKKRTNDGDSHLQTAYTKPMRFQK